MPTVHSPQPPCFPHGRPQRLSVLFCTRAQLARSPWRGSLHTGRARRSAVHPQRESPLSPIRLLCARPAVRTSQAFTAVAQLGFEPAHLIPKPLASAQPAAAVSFSTHPMRGEPEFSPVLHLDPPWTLRCWDTGKWPTWLSSTREIHVISSRKIGFSGNASWVKDSTPVPRINQRFCVSGFRLAVFPSPSRKITGFLTWGVRAGATKHVSGSRLARNHPSLVCWV